MWLFLTELSCVFKEKSLRQSDCFNVGAESKSVPPNKGLQSDAPRAPRA